MDVSYINPFIASACNVFSTMLNCPLKRKNLTVKTNSSPSHEVSAVIGLSGTTVNGSVVFSLSRSVALTVVKQMLDLDVSELNADVADAIGELANMIAGGAKASFSEYKLSLGLPNVIIGRHHNIMFPNNVRPICVEFHTPWGPVTLDVGINSQLKADDQRTGEGTTSASHLQMAVAH